MRKLTTLALLLLITLTACIPTTPTPTLAPIPSPTPAPTPTRLPPTQTGLTTGWYTDNVSTQSIRNLSIYANQGASVMLAYNCYSAGVVATKRYLDEAQRQGIQVWVDMRLHVLNSPTKNDWQDFIRGLKEHPAVFGWYIADEPIWSGPDRATLTQYYNWTKEADPDHPVSIGEAWQIWPEYAGPPPCYDVVLMNCYCGWSGQETGCSDSPDEFNASVRDSYRRWRDGKTAADAYNVSIQAVPLGFGYQPGIAQCQGGVRNLTDAEHRWHTSIPLVLGYDTTIFWWDMMDPSMVQTNPHMKTLTAARFAEISAIATQMTNGTTNDPHVVVSEPQTNLIYRYGATGNHHVILAINTARSAAADNNGKTLPNVQFTLPVTVNPVEIEVLGEDRTLPVTDGTFTDTFTRFQVHAYAFTDTMTLLRPSSLPLPPMQMRRPSSKR